jgi:uncharacterized protein YndB with AHSA1/START domain
VTNAAITADQDSLVSEIEIAAPPERVFQALTDSHQLMCWWTSDICEVELWEMDARVGGRWRFKTGKSSQSINGVNQFEAEGEILEMHAPRLLVYTWLANWHDDKQSRTVVRWDLMPTKSGTKVKVTHSGLGKQPVARKDYSGGWSGVVEQLKKFVEK